MRGADNKKKAKIKPYNICKTYSDKPYKRSPYFSACPSSMHRAGCPYVENEVIKENTDISEKINIIKLGVQPLIVLSIPRIQTQSKVVVTQAGEEQAGQGKTSILERLDDPLRRVSPNLKLQEIVALYEEYKNKSALESLSSLKIQDCIRPFQGWFEEVSREISDDKELYIYSGNVISFRKQSNYLNKYYSFKF